MVAPSRLAVAAGLALLALAGLPGLREAVPTTAGQPCCAPALAEDGSVVEALPTEPRSDERTCKPRAPVEIELSQLGWGPGGRRELSFGVTPRVPLESLSWSVRLDEGGELLDGESQGVADPTVQVRSDGRLSVALPPGVSSAQVVVEARGVLAHATEGSPETVVVERALTWGEPAPLIAATTLLDTSTGSERRRALLPVVHTER